MDSKDVDMIDLKKQFDILKAQGKTLERFVVPWLEQNNPLTMTEDGFLQLLDFILEMRRIGYKYYHLLNSSEV
ncbi:MAG: hypothetical protein GX562_00495 [Coriobacteriaceae bacterium]|nr:hypothetical protein [Coriobacteriaceae bacterium]